MSFLDLLFTFLPIGIVVLVGLYAQRYVKSVVDFMSGGRAAGRYLLAVAGGELQAGAVVFVANFEMIFQSGFVLNWWSAIGVLVGFVVTISGFVRYR